MVCYGISGVVNWSDNCAKHEATSEINRLLKNVHVSLWERGFSSLFTKYDHIFEVSLAV